jgi:hypothetical protein
MRTDSEAVLSTNGARWARRRWSWLLPPLLAAAMTTAALAATSEANWWGTPPINISRSGRIAAWQPDIAVGASGEAIVVWTDQGAAVQDPYTASGHGSSWSAPAVVSQTAHNSRFPDLTASGDRAFVTWVEPPSAVFEAELGISETRAITATVPCVDSGPRLAAGTNELHVLFSAGAANVPDIYHAVRPFTDTAWSAATRAYTSTSLYGSWWAALAVEHDGQTLHAVWENKGLSIRSVHYMSGTVSGFDVQWSSAITLSTGIANSGYPDIAVDSGGNVHVAWAELGPGGFSEQYVRYARYDAAAGSWALPAVRIDPVPAQANEESPTYIAPSVALCEAQSVRACVAWYGFRAGDPEAEEVLIRCSSDGGSSWSSMRTANVSRTTSQSAWEISMRPSIACDEEGLIHAVWQERAGNDLTSDYEVYYSREMRRTYFPLVLNGQQ